MPKKKGKIFVPAKTIEGAKKEWKKQGLTHCWTLIKIRLAKPREYPYKRTYGYKTYALIIKRKKTCKNK